VPGYEAVRWRQKVLSRRFAPWLRRHMLDHAAPAALMVDARCAAKSAQHAGPFTTLVASAGTANRSDDILGGARR